LPVAKRTIQNRLDTQRITGPLPPSRNPSLEEKERLLIGFEVATFPAGSIPCGVVPRFVRRETSPLRV
jgi:hypothetical protein